MARRIKFAVSSLRMTQTEGENLVIPSTVRVRQSAAWCKKKHERALAIREKALGPEHPETAESLNNLASLLKDQGDLAAARSKSPTAKFDRLRDIAAR